MASSRKGNGADIRLREAKRRPGPRKIEEHKREAIESSDSFLLVAEDSGEIKAYIHSKIKDSAPIFQRGDKMKISEIYVKENERRQGLASKLIEEVEQIAEERGCDTLELNVNTGNDAGIEFYRERGLRAEKKRMVKEL